ncbi:class I SAM-dependent methyltransferase [Streptomyces sp. RGM 3693]|uniref:class I SAM-dependent methyltransferase n=1 Tax=Streptomyces sp. RGM 3693 TaxID=3413284 RepID=UPI003D2766FF
MLTPRGPDNVSSLDLVLAADAVLTVTLHAGCGTGAPLHRAREARHRGRLCGLDPSPASVRRAALRFLDGVASAVRRLGSGRRGPG